MLTAAAFACAGCATVVRGTKDESKFESEPAGATVTVESISSDKLGPFNCTTPCELELKRKREWNVVFTLDGYKPATGTLVPKVTSGGVASGAGNVIAGGIIGIGVDAGTGANLDLRPNPMKARFAPIDSANDSVVLTQEEVDAEQKAAKSAKSGKGAATAGPAAPQEPASSADALTPPDVTSDAAAPDAPEALTMDPVESPSEAAADESDAEAPPQN
ncbi:MAG: hypothetical protein A3E78_14785 [Alphaproteobacteria bacterium RIFCSPHIGHO2_12_FULL_63_12]|nr:MAG: hypothetical protein A3E78_14785 [Alphaproteobacteria bacterium RIFCSPHIGHO2_12_FULL_63_12]